MAGLAGCLFANWAEIVTPSVFSLGTTAEVLIWVIVGGLGTLVGPMIAAVVLGSLKLELGHQTLVDNSLVLGAILILVVLLDPARLCAELRRSGGGALRSRRSIAGRRAERAGAASRCRTPNSERAGRRDPGSGGALWRRARGRSRQFRAARTRIALPDRPERRGQEHVFQIDHRPGPRRAMPAAAF